MTVYVFRICNYLRSFQATRPLLVVALAGMFSLTFVSRAAAQASVQGQWQTLPNLMPINPVHAALLHNGKVLIVGGAGSKGLISAVELFDPATSTFARTADMTTPRSWHTATVLTNGQVLVVGGIDPNVGPTATAELYDF